MTVFFIPKNSDSTSGNFGQSSSMPFFYSTLKPMFTVLDPLLEFTYHLLSSWRKFALCIQSLLCMLFLFGWPPCQRSDMILMDVSQHAYDMIHYISGLFGYFSVCEIYVNLIWHLYLFMLNKFCLSLSLSLSLSLTQCLYNYTHAPVDLREPGWDRAHSGNSTLGLLEKLAG